MLQAIYRAQNIQKLYMICTKVLYRPGKRMNWYPSPHTITVTCSWSCHLADGTTQASDSMIQLASGTLGCHIAGSTKSSSWEGRSFRFINWLGANLDHHQKHATARWRTIDFLHMRLCNVAVACSQCVNLMIAEIWSHGTPLHVICIYSMFRNGAAHHAQQMILCWKCQAIHKTSPSALTYWRTVT